MREKRRKKKVKLTKKRKVELPGLELTAGEVFRSCQSWTLYHCATKLRQFLLLKFFFKNVSTGKTVVFTLAALFFTLVFILLFIPSQHYRDIRYFTYTYFCENGQIMRVLFLDLALNMTKEVIWNKTQIQNWSSLHKIKSISNWCENCYPWSFTKKCLQKNQT